MTRLNLRGFDIRKGHLDGGAQQQLIDALRPVLKAAPLFHPSTASGRKMSVKLLAELKTRGHLAVASQRALSALSTRIQ